MRTIDMTEDDIRRIAREEFAKALAEQPQRLLPTVMNGCPRGCLTNTVCLRADCALRLEEPT